MNNTFYAITVCPFRYKEDLVNWAQSYFKRPQSKYNEMKKQQLYAIWYEQAHILKW